MGSIINVKLNLTKVPKEKIYVGEKGKYLSFTIAERQAPDQFGNTHSVYMYDKDAPKDQKKTYIGDAKIMDFDKVSGGHEMENLDALPTQGQLKEQGANFDDLDLPF